MCVLLCVTKHTLHISTCTPTNHTHIASCTHTHVTDIHTHTQFLSSSRGRDVTQVGGAIGELVILKRCLETRGYLLFTGNHGYPCVYFSHYVISSDLSSIFHFIMFTQMQTAQTHTRTHMHAHTHTRTHTHTHARTYTYTHTHTHTHTHIHTHRQR